MGNYRVSEKVESVNRIARWRFCGLMELRALVRSVVFIPVISAAGLHINISRSNRDLMTLDQIFCNQETDQFLGREPRLL